MNYNTKTFRKKVAAGLRRAKRLMNSDGAHWCQGEMQQLVPLLVIGEGDTHDTLYSDPKSCQFCSVGGYRFALFGKSEDLSQEESKDPRYVAGLAALAQKVTKRKTFDLVYDAYDEIKNDYFAVHKRVSLIDVNTLVAVNEEAEKETSSPVITDQLEEIAIKWNDHGLSPWMKAQKRTWEDIENGFTGAAELLEST